MATASSRFDPQPPDRSLEDETVIASEPQSYDEIETPSEGKLLKIIARAEQVSKDYQGKSVEPRLTRSYSAWQNQHAEKSKYHPSNPSFKGRSRLFVPKTRSAVRKNLAAAAGALFSTEDVTNISATFEDDPQQKATASVIKSDLEYRLSRSSAISGIPWFQIAMGACLDSQLTAVCISKQYWEFEEVETGQYEAVHEPFFNPETGEPMLDELGNPVLIENIVPIKRVTKDRPMVDLCPIENAYIDPAAPWYNPVQLGRWFSMRYPVGISDARAMLRSASKRGDVTWKDGVSDETLRKGRLEEDRSGARRGREGGNDRYEDASRSGGALDLVWLQENFVRLEGRDWHFWSVGHHEIISEVREVIESYPEFGGERPYVMGYSQLDTHKIFPQSPVESWQPLQSELNDIANLRLDTLKRGIAPLTLAKRGKNVDLQALQRRGQPETIVMLDNLDDISIVPTPAGSAAAYQETSITNANFDELAGVFSTSSVQQSRQMSETVGGMNLMSRAANSVSEFDLRVWIETWVEPVLRHLVHLVRYYETDEKLVAVAGQKARAWSRYQYMPSVDDFEQCELTVRVNAGVGSVDPIQKLHKMKFAFEMLAPVLPEAAKKGISINVEEIIEEVMGAAGFRDGRRFFEFGEAQKPGIPPEIELKMKELELKNQRLEAEKNKWMGELMVKMEAIKSGERQSAADNDAAISSSEIEWLGRLAQQTMGHAAGAERNAGLMRQKEAETVQRYRMEQLGNAAGPAIQQNTHENISSSPQIGYLLQQLVEQVGVLSQKVTMQETVIGNLFGRMPSAAPAVQ